MNDDFPTYDSRQGSMSLSVDQMQPSATRAVETSDYPVTIFSENGDELHFFEKASDVPTKLTMPVGKYYAEAHTPGVFDKIMDAPYYIGKEDFEILQNINTEATVICRMANGSFTVRFTDLFKETFTSYEVTIDDGSNTAIIFSYDESQWEPATTYMRFEENVSSIKVNFRGTTKKGATITASNLLTKSAASEKYDDDNEYFSGGDAIVIVFNTVESTEGDVTGITINANIKFEESEEDFELDVEDNITGDDEEEGGDTPEGSTAITLDLPKDMVLDDSVQPSDGDATIKAENGIKSILVKISSTSADMIASLEAMVNNYPSVTFLDGAELVGNQDIVKLFGDLNQTLDVPSEGDKEYVFPIGNFFPLLDVMKGAHTFEMIVTDMNGETKAGKLTLTVE
jgi:hypothetical protein